MERNTPIFDSLPSRDAKVITHRYAGIGSRETPEDILKQMTEVASDLEHAGYVLRSGGAKGADSAFEAGVENPSHKQIFYANDADAKSRAIAKEIHPAPERLSTYRLSLMARNTYQIFGRDLNTPVDFVLCWTKDGKEGFGKDRPIGGTGQAVEMAARKGIPVINMKNKDWAERLTNILKENRL